MMKRRYRCEICSSVYNWTPEIPKCASEDCPSRIIEINIDLNKIADTILTSIAGRFDSEGNEVFEMVSRSQSEMVEAMTSEERDSLMSILADMITSIVVSVRFNDSGKVEKAPIYHTIRSGHEGCVACTSDYLKVGKRVINAALVPDTYEKAIEVQDDPRINKDSIIVIIMRNHSGIPYNHYVLPIDDPELQVLMQKCGIEGSVSDVKKAIGEGKSYKNGSGYWICKGSIDSKVEWT